MKFRVARHTSDLDAIKTFYHAILGFDILGSFENHNNYDGLFLGLKNENWHLEFTLSDEAPNHKPDEDDLLVFYPESVNQYNNIIAKLKNNNIALVKAKNPYWNNNGIPIMDPDGFGVVIAKPTKT